MKKLILMSVVLAVATLLTATASAAGPSNRMASRFGGWRSYSYQPAPVVVVQPGYRSFSYEPTVSYGYGPTATYGPGFGRSYQNATNKALGRVN